MERLKEYNAFEAWNKAKMSVDDANMKVAEVGEELPYAEEELAYAQHELEIANGPKEYDAARASLDEKEARVAELNEKMNAAQAVVQELADEVPTLLEDYEAKKLARKAQKDFIKDNANIDVEEFDPAQGPPPLPEEADAASTSGDDQGSTDASGGQGQG